MVLGVLKRLFGEKPPAAIMGSPAANAGVRAVLARNGDDGTLPRRVDHFAYPYRDDCASRQEVFEFLAQFELVLSGEGSQNGVEFGQKSEVASEAFDAFTSTLYDELDAMGWRYDGWGCPVVKT